MKQRSRFLIGSFLLGLMGLCWAVPFSGLAQNFSDVQVKAAYIFKLANYVTQNNQKLEQYRFCYVESSRLDEDSSVGTNVRKLADRKNSGKWSVKRLRGLEGIENCNLLFIADSEESALSTILAKTEGHDILTMSDIRRFISKGGMLGFALDEENRVKMEANLNNIQKTNVMIGAAVLELMQQVIR